MLLPLGGVLLFDMYLPPSSDFLEPYASPTSWPLKSVNTG
jgi:hypothetical protein